MNNKIFFVLFCISRTIDNDEKTIVNLGEKIKQVEYLFK